MSKWCQNDVKMRSKMFEGTSKEYAMDVDEKKEPCSWFTADGSGEGMDPIIELSRMIHVLRKTESSSARDGVCECIRRHGMTCALDNMVEEGLLVADDKFREEVVGVRERRMSEVKQKSVDKESGEEEDADAEVVMDRMVREAKSKHLDGDLEGTAEAYKRVEKIAGELGVALGRRLDVAFALLRVAIAMSCHTLQSVTLERVKWMVESGGGDWERRNRLKVYEAVCYMSQRRFSEAAELFLDCAATFSTYELMSLEQYMSYLVLVTVFACDRPVLRSKVVESPDVRAILPTVRDVDEYLQSFFNGSYNSFFHSLVKICEEKFRVDPLLYSHEIFYHRGMRLRAYSQFLTAYRSVPLQSMAEAFGVSVEFLDKDLSKMIASGRLLCKIDRVGGAVETRHVGGLCDDDSRNALYQSVIRDGDVLLNRIQALSRVVDI